MRLRAEQLPLLRVLGPRYGASARAAGDTPAGWCHRQPQAREDRPELPSGRGFAGPLRLRDERDAGGDPPRAAGREDRAFQRGSDLAARHAGADRAAQARLRRSFRDDRRTRPQNLGDRTQRRRLHAQSVRPLHGEPGQFAQGRRGVRARLLLRGQSAPGRPTHGDGALPPGASGRTPRVRLLRDGQAVHLGRGLRRGSGELQDVRQPEPPRGRQVVFVGPHRASDGLRHFDVSFRQGTHAGLLLVRRMRLLVRAGRFGGKDPLVPRARRGAAESGARRAGALPPALLGRADLEVHARDALGRAVHGTYEWAGEVYRA